MAIKNTGNKTEINNLTDTGSDKKTDENVEKQPKQKIGSVKSRLNYPETIVYQNQTIVISPREEIKKVNESDLKMPLPQGVMFIENIGG